MASRFLDLTADVTANLKVLPTGSHFEAINDVPNPPDIPDLADYVFWKAESEQYDVYSLEQLNEEIGITITQIKLWCYGKVVTDSGTNNHDWYGDLYIGGSWEGLAPFLFSDSPEFEWRSIVFNGEWEAADINAAQVKLQCNAGNDSSKRKCFAYKMEIVFTYDETGGDDPPEEDPPPEPVEPEEPAISALVSAAYKGYAQSSLRRPTLRAYAYWNDPEEVLDLTPWLQSASCSFCLEHEASEGEIIILDKDGRFDPLANGTYAQVFAEHNKVEIYMGYSDEVYKVFTGRIASGSAHYEAGKADEITVPLLDMGKSFWDMKVSSELYTNEYVNTILTDIFTSKGNLTEDEITLAAGEYLVDKIQFIDETLMDIGWMLMSPNFYRLYFNYNGHLVSRPSTPSNISRWDYSLNDVRIVDYEWGDPTTNKVIVKGRNLAPERQLGESEDFLEVEADLFVKSDGTSDHHAKTLLFKWEEWTDGDVYEDITIRKLEGGDSHTDEWWAKVMGPFYYENGFAFAFPGSGDDTLGAIFTGKLVSYLVPRVTGEAKDQTLIDKYGEIVTEIDNPIIQDNADAAALAQDYLDRAKSYRYQMTLEVVQNLSHEPGDRITFPHPRTGETINCQVLRVTHKTAIGGEATTILEVLKL